LCIAGQEGKAKGCWEKVIKYLIKNLEAKTLAKRLKKAIKRDKNALKSPLHFGH
jgi:hypothetical protein